MDKAHDPVGMFGCQFGCMPGHFAGGPLDRLMRAVSWRRIGWTLACMALVVGLLAAWLVYTGYRYRTFHDPAHVPDLRRFITHYGAPASMDVVAFRGQHYYRLIAPRGDFRSFASGPPVFFYDMHGRLWDYTLNAGDLPLATHGLDAAAPAFLLIRREHDPERLLSSGMDGS